MQTPNEYYVYLGFYDFDLDPEVISATLNLQPQWAGRKGDPFELPTGKLFPGRTYQTHFWQYQESPPSDLNPDVHVQALLDRLAPLQNRITDLTSQYAGKIQLVAYVKEGVNPQFAFPPHQIQQIGALGLGMDFDVYCLGAHDFKNN